MGGIEVPISSSYLDCWKPSSDHREHNIAGVLSKIPDIIDAYAYLADDARRNQFGTVLYVTRKARARRCLKPVGGRTDRREDRWGIQADDGAGVFADPKTKQAGKR